MTRLNRPLLHASWRSWISYDLRPVAGPRWLQWLWTLLFCAALAAVFTLLGYLSFARGQDAWRQPAYWLQWYGRHLVVCLAIGGTIHLLFDLARWRLGGQARLAHWSPAGRSLFFAGLPMLGVLIGWPLGMTLVGLDLREWLSRSREVVVGSVTLSLLITFLMHQWFSAKSRQVEAERRATEAQLKLLQGQIEPHFLFNSLAGVISLIEADPPQARRMLQAFTDYLRAALGALRRDEAPLEQELALVAQYLTLMQGRMEDRLRFEIDADDAARPLLLPPLLLQPLVENAIVHGLEPSVAGGTVRVTARVQADRLLLDVHDDGGGPDSAPRARRPGNGMALANLRERLAARYGDLASLSLHATHPGTRASVVLPIDPPLPPDRRAPSP